MNIKKAGKLSVIALSAFIIGVLLTFSQSHGLDYYWVGGSGSWENSLKWSPNGQPQSGDNAYLTHIGPRNISVSYASTLSGNNYLNQLYIDATGPGNITMNIEGGQLQSDAINVGGGGSAVNDRWQTNPKPRDVTIR